MTTREKLLRESANHLAPHESLAALNDASRFLVGSVSVAAALLSALGVLTATKLTTVGTEWALPTVGCAAFSVALAAWATVPVRTTLAPGNVASVEAFFDRQLRVRGGLLRAAGLFFALGVLLAPLPLAKAAVDDATAESMSLDLAASVSGGGTRALISAKAQNVPADSTVEIRATSRNRLLAVARVDVGPNHLANVTLTARPAPRGAQSVVISGRVYAGKRNLLRRDLELPIR
jgi:hypothetical protein